MTSMTTRRDAGSAALGQCLDPSATLRSQLPDLRGSTRSQPSNPASPEAGLPCCPAPRVALVFGECWSRRKWAVCRACGQTTELVGVAL
jgi:hypothetical protein